MQGYLSRIRNWDELAVDADYCVNGLAKLTGRSVRQLERFFLKSTGLSPHEYLRQLRMRRAVELLKDCSQVKEVAMLLRYKQVGHFSRDFRRAFGVSPTGMLTFSPPDMTGVSRLDNKSRI